MTDKQISALENIIRHLQCAVASACIHKTQHEVFHAVEFCLEIIVEKLQNIAKKERGD